jgi:hypothetical protein
VKIKKHKTQVKILLLAFSWVQLLHIFSLSVPVAAPGVELLTLGWWGKRSTTVLLKFACTLNSFHSGGICYKPFTTVIYDGGKVS